MLPLCSVPAIVSAALLPCETQSLQSPHMFCAVVQWMNHHCRPNEISVHTNGHLWWGS
ncbi:hypothetical protein GUJ93_ZPchr0012g19901 [Zizania palustris]|uniref:Uncharacterized protein n=1 Tax=Zizania palustris TaxID=103762 RepID=A0A8J5WPQ7_ZIZPA|nr:hypothetical protein GUJ93_ZPchr0012g19901 [Zizania palustris]